MRIIDISQEVLGCVVYPGDPTPQSRSLMSMAEGDGYNLSAFSMCAHNGTHVDAPFHFLNDAKTIDQLSLEPFVGECYVAHFDGEVTGQAAKHMMERAAAAGAMQRILIAGRAEVSAQAAREFAAWGVKLVGNESQSVGPENAPMEVHKILLGAGSVLLEGIVLHGVDEGKYFLSAAPLNIKGFDGAPCRAYLIADQQQV